MYRVSLLLVLTIWGFSILSAQPVLEPEWLRQVFSVEDGSAAAWDLDVDEDGIIYWPVNVDSLVNGADVYCYKYDQAGATLWPAPFHFSSPGGQFAFSINAKSDAVYVGGRQCLITGFDCDMQLFKIDKQQGSLIWERLQDFGNNGYDEIDGLVVRDGGIFCGGWAQAIQTGPFQIDIGLWKLDTAGNTEWTNYFGQPGTAEHQDGHFVVDDDFIFAGGLYGGSGLFNTYNGSSFIGKFSKEEGSLVDTTLFGPQSPAILDIENVLGMTSDGTHFYLTGYTTPDSPNNWDTFVAKFDADLQLVWLKNWGGSGTESARGINVHNDKIYVAGLTASPEYSPGGAADALLLVIDTDGNYVSHHTWGDTLDNTFRDVAIYDNALYLSGSSGIGFDFQGSISGNLLKINLDDLTGTDLSSTVSPPPIKVFPNPTNGTFAVDLAGPPNPSDEFVVINSVGSEVIRSRLTGQRSTFDMRCPAGLNFYTVRRNGRVVNSGRLVVR